VGNDFNGICVTFLSKDFVSSGGSDVSCEEILLIGRVR
jgi:hypothetical protein